MTATEARLDELGLEALEHLASVLHNDSAPALARIEAAKTILDYALGPPSPGGFLEDDEADEDEEGADA